MPVFSLLLIILTLGSAQAYEFDSDPITDCWNEGGIIDFKSFDEPEEDFYFTADQCNNAESTRIDRNFFAAYGAEEMQKINVVMQEKLEPIWLDNQGHSETMIQESIKLYRTYNYCLQSLCNLISRDCAANSNRQENYQRCDTRRERLLSLSQNQIQMSLEGNLNRKARSLNVEKISTLSLRFDQWIHPRLTKANVSTAIIAKSILALAAYLW